ncbi:MAG TPA: C4-type zinc ribbon domain-containing protein [Pyrinomonadaceae bacterium]|nr:C4-type zinc ribbon domain-containing protein [Pyrinomonadaceae bacterium]
MKAELQHLIALQNLDASIRRLQVQIESIPLRRAEIEKEFDQRASEIKAVEARRDDARHERVRLEKEVAEQRAKAERADRNLMSSKKPDEYTAAIREADAARKQMSAYETQILEQMEIAEQAEATLKERTDEIASLNSDREARLAEFDAETETQTKKLEAERSERQRVFADLPKTVSALYNRISARIRDGVAMAEARNGACSACFMALRPQIMAQVRRADDVITCDNCNRILFFVPKDAVAPAQETAREKVATT